MFYRVYCFLMISTLMLLFLALLTVHVYGGMPRSEPGNFPLDGCSTEEMDVLFLYYNTHLYNRTYYEVARNFAESITFNETKTRVLFAGVFHTFPVDIPRINISSWNFTDFHAFKNQQELAMKQQIENKKYIRVNESIEMKIQLVKRLFSEMGGVRKNVTHVAIVFVRGSGLSLEETRGITKIVQQHSVVDIKIFVVVMFVKHEKYVVHMRDTILVGYYGEWFIQHFLVMAVCNQCWIGWFSSVSKYHTGSMSCYYILDSNDTVNWHEASNECDNYSSSLANIETKEELNIIKSQVGIHFNGHESPIFDSGSDQIQLYIGLKRDSRNLARRFYWSQDWPDETRPMLINHWLPGEPSGGFRFECAIWQFSMEKHDFNVTKNVSRDIGIDGWADTVCVNRESSLSLCEVVLPARIDSKGMMGIKPARNESLSHALTKGDFILFMDNIVSVSANIGNTTFLEALTKIKPDFPIFDCGEGIAEPRYISYFYVCDSVDHCNNRFDELSCLHETKFNNNKKDFSKKCYGVYCCDGSCLPHQWIGDGEIDCDFCDYSSEMKKLNDENTSFVNYPKGKEKCVLSCNGQCVDFSELIDNKIDCTGSDGALEEILRKLETADTCKTLSGNPIWAPRCVYIKDNFGAVLGCRDMSHLQKCTDFECPDGYFKCPDTYCIPQHYVLDGTIDCPIGEEESNYTVGSCIGNFACWDSKVCLHPDLVCDGHSDCPHRDDEVDCKVKCPEGLRCISGTATVTNYTISEIKFSEIDKNIRFLDLSNVVLPAFFEHDLQELSNLTFVRFSQCNILNLDLYFFPHGLQVLDLSYNQIEELIVSEYIDSTLENIRHWNVSYNRKLVQLKHFYFKYLENFDLSHTSLSLLDTHFLQMLPSLKHLNLSFTKINKIHRNTFTRNLIFLSLDLRGLKIVDFREDFFNGLTIRQHLYTDSFELCCPQIRGTNIPYYSCHTNDDVISSCLNLVGTDFQRELLLLVAVIAVVGNMAVIFYRVLWDRSGLTTSHGLFVTNLGISDLIMGVYLFIIAGADYYYRDVYVLHYKRWRESVVCKLSGFLATLSSETSIFFVFLITLNRFFMMKFPFGQVKFSKISEIIALSLSWITGFFLALIPIVFRFEIISSNAMCLGLPLTVERLIGWEFSFAVFIVLNFCLFLLIAYGQRAIFRAMSENRVNRTASRRAEDIKVAKQLYLIAMSNFLCWFPIGLIGLISFSGQEISRYLYSWAAVIILPINSAANPLLYTIPALMEKLK